MTKMKFTPDAIAKKFAKANPNIKLPVNSDTFFEYQNNENGDKGYYKPISPKNLTGKIQSFCKEHKISITHPSQIDNAYRLYFNEKTQSRVEFDSFKYKYFLNFRNCILDVSSGNVKVLAHSPEYLITRQFNVEYAPEAKAPLMSKFLNEALPDEDKSKYFLKVMMYLFIPTYELQKIWLLYGLGGNGKDTVISVIQAMLGFNHCVTLSSYHLAESRFLMAALKDKYVNVSSENDEGGKLSQENLKRLSGDALLTSDVKNEKTPLQFHNFARLIILSNAIPQFDEMNEAIRRRYVIMHFDQTFSKAGVEDTGLKDKLCTETEKSGYLNILLEQLPFIFQEIGTHRSIYFEEPECIKKETRSAFNQMNNIDEFLEEMCEFNNKYESKSVCLYELYVAYCIEHGSVYVSNKAFYNFIKHSLGYKITKRASNNLFIQGLKIKDHDPDDLIVRHIRNAA